MFSAGISCDSQPSFNNTQQYYDIEETIDIDHHLSRI